MSWSNSLINTKKKTNKRDQVILHKSLHNKDHFPGILYIITIFFCHLQPTSNHLHPLQGGGPRVVVSTAAFHARVRGSVPGLGGFKETKMCLPHSRVKVSIVGSLRDREVACSASDHQGSNFESCVWRTVSSHSSHHPQEVLLAQFSLYVHKGGLKPDSFHFIFSSTTSRELRQQFAACSGWRWQWWIQAWKG